MICPACKHVTWYMSTIKIGDKDEDIEICANCGIMVVPKMIDKDNG